MKPKLIILNGSLGSGKSTLAERYANDHPTTLNFYPRLILGIKLDLDGAPARVIAEVK